MRSENLTTLYNVYHFKYKIAGKQGDFCMHTFCFHVFRSPYSPRLSRLLSLQWFSNAVSCWYVAILCFKQVTLIGSFECTKNLCSNYCWFVFCNELYKNPGALLISGNGLFLPHWCDSSHHWWPLLTEQWPSENFQVYSWCTLYKHVHLVIRHIFMQGLCII